MRECAPLYGVLMLTLGSRCQSLWLRLRGCFLAALLFFTLKEYGVPCCDLIFLRTYPAVLLFFCALTLLYGVRLFFLIILFSRTDLYFDYPLSSNKLLLQFITREMQYAFLFSGLGERGFAVVFKESL